VKKGFTLIETIMSVALFCLLFIAVLEILVHGKIFWHGGSVHVDLQTQSRIGLEHMSRELYKSRRYEMDLDPGNTDEISFKIPVGYDVNGHLQWGAEDTVDFAIRYSVNGNNELIRQIWDEGPVNPVQVGADRVLARYVSDLEFSLADEMLTVRITTQRSISGRDITHTETANITLRN